MKVYAVVFSNYEPAEVDSLWTTQEAAEKQRDKKNEEYGDADMWVVREWTVRE